jgi:hypothetical protein
MEYPIKPGNSLLRVSGVESYHYVLSSVCVTGAFFWFRIFLLNVTIGFFEEDTWIFILRRSLINFRSFCILDES